MRPIRSFFAFAMSDPPEMRVTGRTWAVVPRFVSALSILRRSAGERAAYLDWAAATGFNGVRVFGGSLTWAGQSPEMARERLPDLLAACAARGLACEITAVTDSATGYNWRAHLATVADLCAPHGSVIVEGANEIGHPSQADDVTADTVADVLRGSGRPWSVGAPLGQDEPINGQWPAGQGAYSTAHLDRGRDRWEQVRRVRELWAVSDITGTPTLGNEPIGADELRQPGRREDDPALFACLGALDAAGGGGGVHHSQAGLHAVLPGPVQQACAEAYAMASAAVRDALGGAQGTYRNVGHAGSPILAADFSQVVRIYSFVAGAVAVAVHIGERMPTAVYAPGWHVVDEPYRLVSMVDGRRLRIVRLERT